MNKRLLTLLLAASLPALAHVRAADAEVTVESRLRDALRNTMLQMRDLQGQLANAQAAQISLEQKNKEQTAQIEELRKQAIADRNTSANMIAELNTKLAERDTVIKGYEAAFEKWKRAYQEVTTLAQKKEAERAKQEARAIKLDRQVQDQQAKNLKMYQTGMEILDRYEKFGLGDALLAREPFVGSTKVKFQSLIQDYSDKLADQRIQNP